MTNKIKKAINMFIIIDETSTIHTLVEIIFKTISELLFRRNAFCYFVIFLPLFHLFTLLSIAFTSFFFYFTPFLQTIIVYFFGIKEGNRLFRLHPNMIISCQNHQCANDFMKNFCSWKSLKIEIEKILN